MIKCTRIYLISAFITLILSVLSIETTSGQPPPPAPGGEGAGHNLKQSEGGAPIGDGVWILIALGISYGLKRYIRKKEIVPQPPNGDEPKTNPDNNDIILKQDQITAKRLKVNIHRKAEPGIILDKRNRFHPAINSSHFVYEHLQKNQALG